MVQSANTDEATKSGDFSGANTGKISGILTLAR